MTEPLLQLTVLEARVLGALIEKEVTTPDQYPLSINSLRLACNQKSNRDPLMETDESAVQEPGKSGALAVEFDLARALARTRTLLFLHILLGICFLCQRLRISSSARFSMEWNEAWCPQPSHS